MLESALEQLLLQFLAPYVDGIHRDKLHLGVFRGSLELKDLTVKADALALLGFEGFRVKTGTIRVIKLTVPWSKIYTGRLRVDVDAVHLEVEQIGDSSTPERCQADLVREVREAKRKAIDLRVAQLRDLVEHRREQMMDSAEANQKKAYSVKLLRKILNNIHITLSDVRISFVNNHRGLACVLEFPELRVLSTDQSFKERPDTEEVVVSGLSMYKLLKLRGLGIRMASAGSSSLARAEYVLTPISADLQLAQVPSDQILRLRLDVATKEIAELSLRSSQVKHLLGVRNSLFEESVRLHELIVSPEDELAIQSNAAVSKAEYALLYERKLLFELILAGERDLPLNPEEVERLQLLEDALSIRLLARQRLLVRNKVQALNEEVSRRQRDAEKARAIEEQQNAGFMQRVFAWGGADDSTTHQAPGHTQWLSTAEREQLMQDINDNSKVETVDLPQRLKFEFVLGKVSLELADDRWPDEIHRQLLSMALQDVYWNIDVDFVSDHLGRDSAEWRIQCSLSAFRSLHAGKNLCRLCPLKMANPVERSPPTSPSKEQAWLDNATAAKLVLENKLQPAQNLMTLRFEFAPLEIHLLPGAFEQIFELLGTSETTADSPQATTGAGHRASMAEEVVDMSKELFETHGERARGVAEKVYEQMPDRLQLDVKIASPIVHVPVTGLGSATFSLGHLQLVTPEPCAYDSISMVVDLTQTSLRAVSTRGERFNMIEPVPVCFNVQYKATEEVNSVDVKATMQEVALSLAPQGLQILLAVPGALASVFASSDDISPQEQPVVPNAAQRASEFVREVLGEEAGAIEAAARRIAEQQTKQFRCNFQVKLDALTITLADAIVPVMRIRWEMLPPGFVLYQQSVPKVLSIDVKTGSVEVEILNPRNGAWEPVVERFHFGIQVVRTPESEEEFVTHVIISGHQALLMNVTPTAIQRTSWIIPLFTDALDFNEEASENLSTGATANAMKYRLVNLCDHDLEIEFKCQHSDAIVMQVKPTGSLWEPLDDCILPNFCAAVLARVEGGQSSDPLLLECPGAVMVPDCGAVAEMIAISPSQRLLLLASPLRLRNETDLTLFIRFHDAVQLEELLVHIPDTTACNADILGYGLLDGKVESHYSDSATRHSPEENVLMLLPNAYCAVPALALVRARGIVADNVHTWLSIKPAAFDTDFCPALKVGAGIEPQRCRCQGNGGVRNGLRDVNLILESHTYLANPSAPIALTTVTLRPALTLLNALPIGHLTVAYGEKSKNVSAKQDSLPSMWHETHVPRFSRFNMYDFCDVLDGVIVRARLEDDAPWSQTLTFTREDFEDVEVSKPLHLCYAGGASAGILVESLHLSELRFSCPYWLVDRSGLDRPLALEVRREDRPLPEADGITLLPADCIEESCDLVVRSACSVFASHPIRMPPSWCTLPWRTPCGAYVFCIQADDVASSDVLGARCQIMTLRPRLVFTNASDFNIELCFAESRILILPAGQSLEWHWKVLEGDEELPSTGLLFRPLCEPQCAWSGAVVCSDTTAGSTAFLIPLVNGDHDCSNNMEAWSVEIAPVKGALAVSFRKGSDFVVTNRAVRTQTSMEIRPHCSDNVACKISVPPGTEMPFGWIRPFHANKERSVDVIIQGRIIRIADVRRTVKRVLPQLGIVIAITRSGKQTLLSLDDCVSLDIGDSLNPSSQGSWHSRIEVKICSVGISLIEEHPQPRELLFCHLELIRLQWRQNNDDVQQLELSISEMQFDCQLQGRIDGRSADLRRKESLGLIQRERPAVIFANCATGDRAFLSLFLQRSATSSSDFVIQNAKIDFDALDLTIDEWWLDPLVNFLSQASLEDPKARGMSFDDIVRTAGRPIVDGYMPLSLPSVVQVDALQISAISLTVWCSLKLASVHFLPPYVRTAMRVLSLSGRLTLDGAALSLGPRVLPPHRGSLADFTHGLASEYMINLLKNASNVLGKSSVLNLPRVPLKVGRTAVSYLSDTIGLAAGEAASLLNRLTFDEEYVMRQLRQDDEKSIRGLSDGVVEASKSLAQGVEGLFDVVRKPVQGAQRNGLKGFLAGVGRGVAGSFVKPISKFGQAISDVGSGMAATATTDSTSMKRRRARLRQRHPRLLYSDIGVIRPWSDLDAELMRQLGRVLTSGIECVVPLTQQGPHLTILMLFARRLVFAEVKTPSEAGTIAASVRRKSPVLAHCNAASSQKKPDHILEALDETSLKLVVQALKPINTLVYGVQDLNRELSGKRAVHDAEVVDSDLMRKARECLFSDLVAVRKCVDGGILQLEDAHGNAIDIPLFASPIGDASREALAIGFRSALDNAAGIADWTALNMALTTERRQDERKRICNEQNSLQSESGTSSLIASQPSTACAGRRTLEVFEVERWSPTMGEWTTPFLPTDRGLSWRWVDATGSKHPHLAQDLTRQAIVSKSRPPCRAGALFQSMSDWTVDMQGADTEGWRYGISWNASTWDVSPGLLDALRKRRWTRTYL